MEQETNTRFFVDAGGNFIGAFGDGAEPPEGATEVLVPPPDGKAIWANGAWSVPVDVPAQVSRFQGRAGLIVYGMQIGRPQLLQEADAFVAGLTAGQFNLTAVQVEVIKEAWATAQVFRRDSPFLNLLFPGLGLQLPEQLDALFIVAAQQIA